MTSSKGYDRTHDGQTLQKSPSMIAGDEPVYHMRVKDVLDNMGTNAKYGLDRDQVEESRRRYGDNLIETVKPKNIFVMIFGHLVNSIGMILILVFIVNCINKEWIDAGVIMFVYLSNAAMGFVQELKSERALLALRKMSVAVAFVLRENSTIEVPIQDVVVGDIVLLKVGDEVPADLRLISATNLEIDEALLTGESVPAQKITDPLPYPEQTVQGLTIKIGVGDRTNMAFRQSSVVQGNGIGIVTAVSYNTQVGELSKKLMVRGTSRTPLQIKMERFMFMLFGVALLLALIVFWIDDWRFRKESIVYAAATGIAIVPEGLVAVVTIALALAVNRLAQKHVIVKKLGVVETLATVTNVCSDKTGTLTEGKMAVKRFWVPTLPYVYHVFGGTMDSIGAFAIEPPTDVEDPANVEVVRRRSRAASIQRYRQRKSSHENLHDRDEHLLQGTPETELSFIHQHARDLALVCSMCNNTQLQIDEENEGRLIGSGNPTELALQVFAHKLNQQPSYWEDEGYVKCGQWAFDSSSKCMSVGVIRDISKGQIVRTADGELITREALVLVKGAPEVMFKKCVGVDVDKTMEVVASLASQGFRVLACAIGDHLKDMDDVDGKRLHDYKRDVIEVGLRFVGLAVVYDPPRADSKKAVELCRAAGIVFRMVTGDHHATAENISRRLGILSEDDGHDRVITGPVLDAMSEEQIDALPYLPLVIARCSPESKVKMVEALHRRGERVAMTGDGINDAPAIKIADVGAAMGIAGVDITKNVADIVLADDSITSLVSAVEEGRNVAASIKKFIVHLLTGNCAEVITLMIGLAISDEHDDVVFPLSPLQVLWINMATSTPPAIGLTMDPVNPDTMYHPPQSPNMFTLEVMMDQMSYGVLSGVLTLCSYLVVIYGFGDGTIGYHCNIGVEGHKFCNLVWRARSTAFAVLNQQLLVLSYVCRSPRGSLFGMTYTNNAMLASAFIFGTCILFPIFYVPWIAQNLFKTAPIDWEWGIVCVTMITTIVFSEVYKCFKRKFGSIQKTVDELNAEKEIEIEMEQANRSFRDSIKDETIQEEEAIELVPHHK